ncbi:hypothetical protein BASA50_005585 [Batrachochytrium salamandrivorans]|uniref:Uncharacterized protein n=1 Tax=Batrachochytrium salamandrivorans TaxID=1357716 RepID=A0ABQ8FCV9_9FUNG|nr:hypothetical protein BASA50_005585 [Batrachochytrium salamandrivorans]
MIKHTFKNDEYHNEMLISMYNTKEEILQLASQIGPICFKYIDNTEGGDDTTQTKFITSFNPDSIDYKDVMKLLDAIDTLFNDFVKFESEYFKKYRRLPNNGSILSSKDIEGIVESIKDELKSII